MGEEARAAARHRRRAQNLRVIANDQACPPKTRESLMRMAEDCERIAENLEAIDRMDNGSSPKT
jgi:hypothetical protein